MAQQPLNFNNTTPAIPANMIGVQWQADSPAVGSSTPRNISGYIDPSSLSGITVNGVQASTNLVLTVNGV